MPKLPIAVILAFIAADAGAQGLFWKLPQEDNVAVLYEGKYVQRDKTEQAVGDVKPVEWLRRLEVKSLGKQPGDYGGKTGVPCRLLEIKVTTGRLVEGEIDPGPAGSRIYKVLVPEHKVVGDVADADTIPTLILPIARGVRKIGLNPPEPIKSNVLYVSPVISLMQHYRQLAKGGDEQAKVSVDGVDKLLNATQYTGGRTLEDRENRVKNEAEIVRSDELPFGLARWKVTVTRWTKDVSDPRDRFDQTPPESTYTVEMAIKTVVVGKAQSELPALK